MDGDIAKVAVLFARADSIYKTMPECDVYDIDRDARTWPGGCPVVAHPPCRAWAGLRHMANPRPDERSLAPWAIEQVRQFGGVLEHPARSQLWPTLGLPGPGGGFDRYGGWTLGIEQHTFGHRAQKRTLLYIVGCEPIFTPIMPWRLGEASHQLSSSGRRLDGTRSNRRPHVTKPEREHTPPLLARWLVDLAMRCRIAEVVDA